MKKHFILTNFIIISILILLFQYNLQLISPIFNYYDEFIIILFYFIYLINIRNDIKKTDIYINLMFLIIFIFGIIGNLKSSVNLNFLIIITDFIGILKPLVCFIFVKRILNQEDYKLIIKKCNKIFIIYILIAAMAAPFAYIFKIDSLLYIGRLRFGIYPYRFICENEGIFGYIIMMMICMLCSDNCYNAERRFIISIGLILIALTTKGPQLIFVALFLFLNVFKIKKLNIKYLILMFVLCLLVGQYQLETYLKLTEARVILLITSIKIALDYFPFGTGFGTFASDLSTKFSYSKIYYDYQLNEIWGISETYHPYVTDNFWAMIIGQFGFIIMIILVINYLNMFVKMNNSTNNSYRQKRAILATFITIMIGSIGSSYITSFIGCFCFIILGISFNKSNKERSVK